MRVRAARRSRRGASHDGPAGCTTTRRSCPTHRTRTRPRALCKRGIQAIGRRGCSRLCRRTTRAKRDRPSSCLAAADSRVLVGRTATRGSRLEHTAAWPTRSSLRMFSKSSMRTTSSFTTPMPRCCTTFRLPDPRLAWLRRRSFRPSSPWRARKLSRSVGCLCSESISATLHCRTWTTTRCQAAATGVWDVSRRSLSRAPLAPRLTRARWSGSMATPL
mmetsp:Transcript_30189/g.79293  ORF Transcript_30189/g.79293 Transcript_30189/m.79293 type:complete len:218 (+) Transcript_30189:211-864(+)